MNDDTNRLSALRDEIDAIDRNLHELIMRRTEVVEGVRAAKEGAKVMIRPSREAKILYRLMAEHKGGFPKRELARIWRELCGRIARKCEFQIESANSKSAWPRPFLNKDFPNTCISRFFRPFVINFLF